MDDAFFTLIEVSSAEPAPAGTESSPAAPTLRQARFLAAEATGGPWSPDHQHGGPPNALLVHAAEQAAAAETGRTDLHALRLAAEFLRPVPVGDVTVTTRLLRAARTVVLVEATLSAGGKDCLTGRIWLVRQADTSAIAPAPARPSAIGPAEDLPDVGATFPYGRSIEWRSEFGSLREAGPARVWGRPRIPLVRDYPLSALARAALIGDSASGVSSELDWGVWAFLNIDLDVHVARPISGEWLLMDAVTTLTDAGAALTRSVLSDDRGVVGTTAQTLVVEPRRR